MNPRQLLARIGFYTFVAVVTGLFALPMLWLASAPFDAHPGYAPRLPEHPTLQHFSSLFQNSLTMGSLWNSVLLSAACTVLVVGTAALAAYALSRVRIPGRDALLYLLLLLSSVVTGTAAMVPIFLMIWKLGLLDQQLGVVLVLSGGLLPAAIFILKDFMDSVPRSYEESARVFGAGPFRILRDIVLPVARPGLATIAVWTVVNVWGSYLVPFLLLRDQDKQPAAVVVRTFYDEGGGALLGPISAFSLLYSIPVVLMYLFVNRRYGFRIHGGIKS
ncbi:MULTISPECIES: carbohydrate ABC transporter permease [unclassified Nocardia]|uniref:carbohydrate ABC transporter permease n=1 Tax=unclassified Nocardia TaxID=2637762 RepID=UPI001CE3FD9A|nr:MULTISPECIES: carbohydrate ABC transporter permease [unclassified Nocardia]